MKTPTEKARDIWEAFCEELTQPPTDDMREALATSLRVASDWILPDVEKLDKNGCGYRDYTEDERRCCERLLIFANELENLE